MDELRETALAYYENLPESKKQLASDFFKSLDGDGDGKIDVQEYIAGISKRGFKRINNADFFKVLDKDENGSLDFDEVLTLFYLRESGRLLFCDGCGEFVKGVYFTCLKCNPASHNSFDLCCSCYRSHNFHHHHDHTAFVDNYVLLQHKLQPSKAATIAAGAELATHIFEFAGALSNVL